MVLEDNPKRINVFNEMFHFHELWVVGEPKEAIELLKQKKWDILFLDHDLYGQIHVPSGPGTGWEVAKFLSKQENLKYNPKEVIIHSHNEKGAKNMQTLLPWAKMKWFGLFAFNGKEVFDLEPNLL